MTIIKYWVGEMLRFFVAVERLPPAVVDDRLRLFVAVERQALYNVVQPEPEQALHITSSNRTGLDD
jgi:hypothetical protein